jgi:hypothetical protein
LANVSLRTSRFQEASYKINIFAAEIDAGTSVEDIMQPEYWANIASRLRPHGGDEIIAVCDDLSFRAHLFVVSAGRTWAKVCLIGEPLILHAKESPEIQVADGEFAVKWAGPHDKWRVIRTVDKEVITKGHATRDAAEAAVKEYLKVTMPRPKAAE